jgi:hypothetical protein
MVTVYGVGGGVAELGRNAKTVIWDAVWVIRNTVFGHIGTRFRLKR